MPRFLKESPTSIGASTGLLLARVVAGGALVFAGFMKLKSVKAFMLSIEGFGLVPVNLLPVTAHFLPWFEIVVGLTLVLGIWTRQAAVYSVALYTMFTGAIAYALMANLDISCGCFGDIFSDKISGLLIIRNIVFIGASAAPIFFGGGLFSVMREKRPAGGEVPPVDATQPTLKEQPSGQG